MKFGQADVAEAWVQGKIRRIAGEPCARDALLDDVERLYHDARKADMMFLHLGPGLFDRLEAGAVLDDGGSPEDVVVEVYRHDERLLVGAADRCRNGVYQGAVHQCPIVAGHGFKDAGKCVGGAQRRDQRTVADPDLMACVQFRCDRHERTIELFDG